MTDQAKRISALAKFLRQLAQSDAAKRAIVGNAKLPAAIVEDLCRYLKENGMTYGDLTALRNTPGKHERGNPYDWLWLLHRSMNHHRHEIRERLAAGTDRKELIAQVLEDLHSIQSFESDRMSSSGIEVLSRCIRRLSTLV